MPEDYTHEYISQAGCVPPRSYTHINFDNAVLVQSNLGGQGGRCSKISYMENGESVTVVWNQLCSEPQPGAIERTCFIRHSPYLRALLSKEHS